jgi:competence protein ComEC
MSAPFVWIFVCFAAGILNSHFFHLPVFVLIPAALLTLLSLLCEKFRSAVTGALLLIFLLGAALSQKGREEYNKNGLRSWVRLHEREVVSLEGTLTRTPELSDGYFVLQMRVETISGVAQNGNARVTVSGELKEPLVFGDRIQSFGRFRLPKNFRTPGAFDYEQYLRGQNIHVLGAIKSSELIHRTGSSPSLRTYFSAIRLRWIRGAMAMYSSDHAGILRALWLDDRGGISHAQERILTDAGIFHVVAISGFHISVLLVILFFALKRLVSFRWAIAVACLLLLFYFLLLEGRSSVTRAFLSFLILAFAIWKYEQIRLANWICLSAWIQLVLNPQELYDAGFQLTYLSTAAILFLVIPACQRFRHLPKRYRYPLNFLVTGAIVQIALIPYQVYVFHRIPLYTFFANMIAVPVSSLLIASSILLVPVRILARILVLPVQKVLTAFMSSAGFFADQGVQIVSSPPLIIIFAFYLCLLLAIVLRRRRLKVLFILFSTLALAMILISHQPKASGAFEVHFLDVGQGDAILLGYPDGTYDLVDGGGFFNLEALDTGETILLPYLCRLGVTRLNRIFLTHAHADHMYGLISLMRYIPVKELCVTRQPVGARNYQYFLRSIHRAPIPISRGKKYERSGVNLEVLFPDDSRKTNDVGNDDSLVLLISYRGKRILLTGDVEMDAERNLINRIPGPIDYLKVAHHGSKTSSSELLLRSIKPRIAFISVGSNNWFGHPHPHVLSRLRKNHVIVYRTDIHGMIRLRISDQDARVIVE